MTAPTITPLVHSQDAADEIALAAIVNLGVYATRTADDGSVVWSQRMANAVMQTLKNFWAGNVPTQRLIDAAGRTSTNLPALFTAHGQVITAFWSGTTPLVGTDMTTTRQAVLQAAAARARVNLTFDPATGGLVFTLGNTPLIRPYTISGNTITLL